MSEPAPEAEPSPKSGLRSLVSCAVILALVVAGALVVRAVLKGPEVRVRKTSEGYHLEVEGRSTVIPLQLGPECSEPQVEPGRSQLRVTWVARGAEVAALLYADGGALSTELAGASLEDGESLALLPNGDLRAVGVGERVQVEVLEGELGGERAQALIYQSEGQSRSFVSVELLVDELPLESFTESSFSRDAEGWEWILTQNREVYGLLLRAGTLTYSRSSRGKNGGATALERAWFGPLEELPERPPEVEAPTPSGSSG